MICLKKLILSGWCYFVEITGSLKGLEVLYTKKTAMFN